LILPTQLPFEISIPWSRCGMSEGSVDVLDRRTKIAPLIRCLIWLTAIGLLAGCKGGIDQTLEQTIEESYPLEPSGTLSIRSEDGSIRVYGSDSPELELQAIKKAYSIERLNGIKVQVSAGLGSVSVETIFPSKKKWSLSDRSGTVDYTVIVPQNIRMINLELANGEISIEGLREGSAKASLVNGRMTARNCFENMDYRVVNGWIDLYYNWWEKRTYLVKVTIDNGAESALVPGNASFRIAAKAPGGQIRSNLVRAEGTKKLMTTVGSDPGPTFEMEARTGNIKIQGY
jgi:DUF4097 and DUF4098 domain-containing protein YvlB